MFMSGPHRAAAGHGLFGHAAIILRESSVAELTVAGGRCRRSGAENC